ncbi:MAG: anthranilate synthase component I family protein [Bacteroidota bacterium]|nr:anthranilate synthase component I family protein [Bacteroidota bacterium]
MDNHEYNFRKSFDCIAGAGVIKYLLSGKDQDHNLEKLDQFQKQHKDWLFGHISYDLKNEIEDLSSSNFDGIQFPVLLFFVPEIVFILNKNELQIGVCSLNPDLVFNQLTSGIFPEEKNKEIPFLKSRLTKKNYVETVKTLQTHILKGDCYEINFCQEFFATDTKIDPVYVYRNLNIYSPNPFSAFYKYKDKFLMCASPERFLKREGDLLISQPMKGTAKRILNDENADLSHKDALRLDAKERSENIMIVDLVRNDLTKVCIGGSVKVEEFLEIYSFPQVHQMISTVTGILNKSVKLSEIFKSTFPMGSMTGAPKKRVMELIEKYEKTKRGLFSGTIGYFDPEGNFDFNVVIRSLQYNSTTRYLSIIAGSAITFHSIPEKEYEECLLKISAMKKSLE